MSAKTVLLLFMSIIAKTIACSSGWFGSLCQFQCHCTNNLCDMNGTCSRSSNCLKEWFGPSCQLQNLAMVYTITETIPSFVFDGDETTCNSDSINQHNITISWNISYVFPFLRIKLSQKAMTKLDEVLTINITPPDSTSYKVSYITDTLIDIIFDKEVTAYRLDISGSLVESICELYISGGIDVALKKDAAQSSVYTQFNNLPEKSQASNAVDGNRATDWYYGSCSHTDQLSHSNFSTHSWSVDFGNVYAVNRYVIYNRIDSQGCCPERLHNFSIESYNSPSTVVFKYEYNNGSKAIYSVVFKTTRVTMLRVENYDLALSICEMEIYGEPICPQGMYGLECGQSCNCADNGSCLPTTGACCAGCRAGFFGEGCSKALLEDTTEGQDTPLAAIIAPVIAGVVLLPLLIVRFLIWRKRKRQSTQNKGEEVHTRRQIPPTTTDVISVTDTAQTDANGNVGQIDTCIRILDLNRFLQTHNKEFFVKQFKCVPETLNVTTEVGLKNAHKNRNEEFLPYDHSRVHLEINTEANEGDYINASYVRGYKESENFIACQDPNIKTVNDFIRMLWEQHVDKVVMLTNLTEYDKMKCKKYWPEKGEKEFGSIKVKLTITQVCAEYTIRRLELRKINTKVKNVTQFHFTSWPETGVPKTPWSLADFEQSVAAEPNEKPIVVHCSSGVGRTGTFIALCNVMSQAKETGGMDFFQTLVKLHNDRMLMIQTEEQYEFLHRAAQVALLCLGTTVTAANIIERVKVLETNNLTNRTNMDTEFDAVCNVSIDIHKSIMTEEVRSDKKGIYHNTSALGQRSQNRFPEIIPPNAYRTILTKENNDMGDYINAILLPSFQKQNHQIVTQLPLSTTVVDFWRLVTQYNVCIVIAFEGDSFNKDQSVAHYLPKSADEPLSCAPFEIKSGPVMSKEFWEEQTITVHLIKKSKRKSSDYHVLKHIRYKLNSITPEHLMNFIKKIQVCASQKAGVVLFMCRNGAEYSGLACVLKLLLDRMDNGLQLTIPIVVGAVKSIRPQVIPSVEQYTLLYQVLQMYHQRANTYYSNVCLAE